MCCFQCTCVTVKMWTVRHCAPIFTLWGFLGNICNVAFRALFVLATTKRMYLLNMYNSLESICSTPPNIFLRRSQWVLEMCIRASLLTADTAPNLYCLQCIQQVSKPYLCQRTFCVPQFTHNLKQSMQLSNSLFFPSSSDLNPQQ